MKLFFIGFAILATVCAEYSNEYQIPQDGSLAVGGEIAFQAPSNEYLAPIAPLAPVPEIASGVLADDGYRYKTVRRLRHRRRRDVSELTQYLPPTQEIVYEAPSNEYLAPIAPVSSGVLADDGYRYKTVRKLRHRRRRDVSELTQYLPPTQEISYEAPSNEYLAPIAPVASGVLADDGYRYKTVRKLRHRRRRDVSELTQYLPPTQEISYEAPSNEYLAPIAPVSSGVLADDGYRYKTVRKLRHRRRRDVSELTQYLPPTQEIAYEAPSNEYLAPIAPVASGVLADDGYRYKAVRRLRLRHRRDVSELPSAQYLPPVEQVNIPQTPVVSVAPVADIPIVSNEYLAPVEQNENILANDGYRYKTVKRFKIRRH
ncbi:nuclear pore complex-interacting protein family member B13-like [Episyrphus balteatus]|uniref:nuclear pore complex-interacting protein family member B13-like n=1 Tax=Episyrphus balteatus TaxID=286459 RepID=UPI0024867864|nr:nuclear pore complex-interacting protein family member B13-like [Episyrphus balteatus]